MSQFARVHYADLNSRQKENYNFHLVAARLAKYGFNALRLSDDFEGADFIALHIDGETLLRVQLKGRLCFDKKYYGKGLHIAFRDLEAIYVYPHDELREEIRTLGMDHSSRSERWLIEGSRSWPQIPKNMRPLLEKYKL